VKDGIPHPPKSIKEVEILDGVREGLSLLREHNFEIVVVTNQPDVARGISTLSDVQEINNYIGALLSVDHFYTCFHDDSDQCNCRKPKNGLILKAAADLNLDLRNSYMVGDRWRDIEAGQTSGCICYFIDYSYIEKSPKGSFLSVASLLEAAELIARGKNVRDS